MPLLFYAGLGLLNTGCAQTPSSTAAQMPLGTAVLAPEGYLEFCQQRPDQCGMAMPISAADRVALRRGLLRREWQSVLEPQPTSVGATSPVDAADRSNLIQIDDPGWRLLDQVNATVNARIIPSLDPTITQSWSLPAIGALRTYGDCKRYVLEKRRLLAASGVPAAALSIAIVRTPRGDTHAVLLVATDKGEYVLDNLSRWAVPWPEARYHWIERQKPGEPLHWVTIGAAADTLS